jgi:DTW domain-containing protein YfiP
MLQFVILIHPLEFRRKIATGRMAHLGLKNSLLVQGTDFTDSVIVNQLIQKPENHCSVLYPGADSVNISFSSCRDKNTAERDHDKNQVIFVIDGTWATARKTMRLSQNLQKLPKICFIPKNPSQFRIRKQPAASCYSTIEAIHHVIELVEYADHKADMPRPHDQLLVPFLHMVEQQLKFL